ncbi:reverse transcriptase domain-containing protein [Roseovarius sp. Pro17]|uniref:reverse transcriptase domain-containing protein n=1 Tax=Roseovarius sp. Pro17 TaxID=3108175 RepID=UPI002D77DB73|nr:reverse transcriptase domain-containing protein [Roseovarius sp. Pro17]
MMTVFNIPLLPSGSGYQNNSPHGFCKIDSVLLPQSKEGNTTITALATQLAKARKFEQRLRSKCENAWTDGNPSFPAHAKTYLTSRRCQLVALFEDNARQPLKDRLSLEEMATLATTYKALSCLNEAAKIWTEPKLSGGVRVICAFGPVARSYQRMVRTLLRMTYKPQDFQFTHLGSAAKIQLAMSLIKEKGYTHVAEIDIKDFFPSFSEGKLVAALPLPKEAIRQIVLAKGADWYPSYANTTQPHILSPPGIPQGSASSAEVAHWCIAHMSMEKVEGVDVINHADNFFIFAVSKLHMEGAAKALRSGIAGLLGGEFQGKTEQAGEIAKEFRMLGCCISMDKAGNLVADPTDTNLKKLVCRARTLKQRVHAKLTAAEFEADEGLRVEGLQDFLRLESLCHGWINAFKFCGPQIKYIEDEHLYDLDAIRDTYCITQSGLEPLKDASTLVNIKWYSGG